VKTYVKSATHLNAAIRYAALSVLREATVSD